MNLMSGARAESAAVQFLPLQRYLEVVVYLLALTGFATLASTGGLDLPGIVFVSSALLIRGYLLASGQTLIITGSWTTILTVGYAIYYLADYFLISRSFISATVHLVLFVLVVRLFSTQRERDYYFLAVISFLMVLAAAVLTVDSVFLVTFALFMLTAVASVVLMEMNHASLRARSQPKARDGTVRRLTFSLARVSPLIMLLILGGATGIFFVLPRVSAGYLRAFAPRNEYVGGFSDQVQLGGIGEIQQSSALVMHIQIDGDTRGSFTLKWRGVYLNSFDGKSWTGPRAQHAAPRLPGGDFVIMPPDSVWRAAGTLRSAIHYRVLMEPIGTNIFFLASTPLELRGNYRAVGMDGSGAVFDLDPDRPVGRYEGWSDTSQPAPDELRRAAGSYPPEVGVLYLRVPALDPRIGQLARHITANLDNNYDRAAALDIYLRTHFGYTLQLPGALPADPLADFLFERKEGHCEYFASALAIMLRDVGIPSRLVNGFRTGEFNDLTSQYVIRASNAHSWVEAYFPGYGWVSFDPTPGGIVATPTGWERAALYLDAARSFWREWVVNYDVSHQQTLGEATVRTTRRRFWALRQWYRARYAELVGRAGRMQRKVSASPVQWFVLGLAGLVLVFVVASAGRLWRWMRRRRIVLHPENSPPLAATVWYERMTRTLARRGWRKSPLQTPQEFLQSIAEPQLRASVERFTWHYEGARFGDVAEDAHQLSGLYEEVVAASRNRAGAP